MDSYTFFRMIEEHVLLPVIIAFGAAILLICKHFFDKISKSIVAKNEISEMDKQVSIRNKLMITLQESVKTAVASNMQTASAMKSGGRKLEEYQIQELNNSAMNIVLGSLPPSLTEEGGVLLDFIGSKEKLNGLISAMIEKYVYEYKISEMRSKNQIPADDESDVPTGEYPQDNSETEYHESDPSSTREDVILEQEPEVCSDDNYDNEKCETHRKIRKTPTLY